MKNYILIILFIIPFLANSQIKISGKIIEESTTGEIKSIPGVIIRNSKGDAFTKTNTEGEFKIFLKTLPDTLIINQLGYALTKVFIDKPIENLEIKLNFSNTLETVVINGNTLGKSIDLMSALNVERIGEGELRKAACCNLSEAFETNASVDVSLTDAVSGAKKIQMLGLDGIYSQIQWENIPLVRGLSSSYGLGFTPGTWINSIQITKGTGSVINGYESIAGLINLEFKKPSSKEKLYLNTYANSFGKGEFNIHGFQNVGKWKTMSFLHLSNQFLEVDRNKDGFKDIPIGLTAAFFNRWEIQRPNSESKFGFKLAYSDKTGGQLNFNNQTDNQNLYGVNLLNKQVEIFTKNGFFFKKRPLASLGTILQLKYHEIGNQFGYNIYNGKQKKIYFNGIYSDVFKNTNHNYKTGVSMVVDNYNQYFNYLTLNKTEIIPGAFFEYTYKHLNKLSVVSGVRGDFHNLFGFIFSPRLHAKWNISPKNVIRISAGKGTRVSNPFADYTSLMASNRNWVLENDLMPEEAINGGLTFTQKFLINDHVSSFSVDYFYTQFINQVVVDLDKAVDQINIYNAMGTSYSHSFQAELSLKPSKTIEFRSAFKYYDVKLELDGNLQQKAFTPKFRALFNIGYKTRNKKWEYDLTGNWVGVKRLPNTSLNPIEHQRPAESKAYWLLNTQITYKRPRTSFYIGGENLLNIIQENAIIGADDPFGSHFDATQIWAPITGVNIYVGFHYKLKTKK